MNDEQHHGDAEPTGNRAEYVDKDATEYSPPVGTPGLVVHPGSSYADPVMALARYARTHDVEDVWPDDPHPYEYEWDLTGPAGAKYDRAGAYDGQERQYTPANGWQELTEEDYQNALSEIPEAAAYVTYREGFDRGRQLGLHTFAGMVETSWVRDFQGQRDPELAESRDETFQEDLSRQNADTMREDDLADQALARARNSLNRDRVSPPDTRDHGHRQDRGPELSL